MTSAIIAGNFQQVRSPSSAATTKAFIDHCRAIETCRSQSVSSDDIRNEITSFSSVGVLSTHESLHHHVLQVNPINPPHANARVAPSPCAASNSRRTNKSTG